MRGRWRWERTETLFDTTSSSFSVRLFFSHRTSLTFSHKLLCLTLNLDSFKAIEAKHPDIVAIDSQGVVRNAIDLFAKEKRETAELTSAMEVSPGFWMGNTNDCPLSYGSDGDGVKTVKVEANPIGFDVCIEVRSSLVDFLNTIDTLI